MSSVLPSRAGVSVGHRQPLRAGSGRPGSLSRRGRVCLSLPAARAVSTLGPGHYGRSPGQHPGAWCFQSVCCKWLDGMVFRCSGGIWLLNVLFYVIAGLVCRADTVVNSCLTPESFKRMMPRPLPSGAPAPAPLPRGSRSSQVPCRKQRQRVVSGLSASGSHGPGRAGSLPGAQTGAEAGSPRLFQLRLEGVGQSRPEREECGKYEHVPQVTGARG